MSQTLHYGTGADCTCRQSTESKAWDAMIQLTSRVPNLVARWREKSRQRHALQDLDDRLLEDIGVLRAVGMKEAAKPFWIA